VAAAARIRRLEGRVRHYDWGSRERLAAFRGEPVPAPEPEAELWFGSHPVACARVEEGGDRVPLDAWIARDPEGVLGRDVVQRFGARLPFLAKLLAVERPLSLQVHPDARRAREGFEREERAGIPLDAALRCYRDPHAKPEFVCALDRFAVLLGFRPLREVAERLELAGLGDRLAHLADLRRRPGPETWRAVLGELLLLPRDACRELLAAAGGRIRAAGCPAEVGAWLERLSTAFPDDVGALAPLFLEHRVLEPGEALFLPPGQLHTYLDGLALEVMASSDNVVRAGLTSKHVDREEFLRIADFAPRAARPLAPSPVSATELVFATGADEFRVARIDVRPDAPHGCDAVCGVEVLVCVEGAARVVGRGDAGHCALPRGAAALVPAASPGYAVEGDARVYRVSVPPPERVH
jgi:mannose-6-phosphate isomerase